MFSDNILSIINQQNICCANVKVITSFRYPKSNIITLPDLKESELVTNTDSMMAIFHHHNIINILISQFQIMTFLAHLNQIQLRHNRQHSPHAHTQSSGGFEETPNHLYWVWRMKKPRGLKKIYLPF